MSKNEAAAKDASRGLRRAFKYAQASPQLTAARLWAFMLRNTSDIFLRETSGRKFMDAVEEVVTNPKTEPVVRERLLDVLGSAVSEYTKGDRKHPYAVLWRKLKSKNQPEQVKQPAAFSHIEANSRYAGHPSRSGRSYVQSSYPRPASQ